MKDENSKAFFTIAWGPIKQPAFLPGHPQAGRPVFLSVAWKPVIKTLYYPGLKRGDA